MLDDLLVQDWRVEVSSQGHSRWWEMLDTVLIQVAVFEIRQKGRLVMLVATSSHRTTPHPFIFSLTSCQLRWSQLKWYTFAA